MGIEINLHAIQKDILRVLLFNPKISFSKLNRSKISTDRFNFHLKRLINIGLVEKLNGAYLLTEKGKEFANRLDTESQIFEKQAKISVLICCVDNSKNITKYLVQQRLKEPYFGFHGFMTGKVRLGETIFETAKRELMEETGLSGKLELAGVKHKMDYSKDKKLLEDKFFFVIKATDLRGELKENIEGGKNMWLTRKELSELPNVFDGALETFELVSQKGLEFIEKKYKVKVF